MLGDPHARCHKWRKSEGCGRTWQYTDKRKGRYRKKTLNKSMQQVRMAPPLKPAHGHYACNQHKCQDGTG